MKLKAKLPCLVQIGPELDSNALNPTCCKNLENLNLDRSSRGLLNSAPVPTQLAEVQGGPVKASRAGGRQWSDTDSAMKVQTPQSITTGRQVGQLHLATQTDRQTDQ